MKSIFFIFMTTWSTTVLALSNPSYQHVKELLPDNITTLDTVETEKQTENPYDIEAKKFDCENSCPKSHDAQVASVKAYGSVFTEEFELIPPIASVVTPPFGVSFTGITPARRNVALRFIDGGSLILERPGHYFVIFGVSALTDARDDERMALTLNDILVPGSNFGVNFGNQMNTASAIVLVEKPNSVLKLVNFSPSFDLQLSTNFPGDVTAFITAQQLDERSEQSSNILRQ